MRLPSLLILAMIVVVTGCAYQTSAMPGMMIPGKLGMEQLTRDDYAVINTAKGEGCTTWIALFPIPIWWTNNAETKGNLYNWDAEGSAMSAALYNAIEAVPDADAILSPRFKESGEKFGIWYDRSCVTAKGKAIRIKSDLERQAAARANEQGAVPAPAKQTASPEAQNQEPTPTTENDPEETTE